MPITATHDWDSPPDPYTRRAYANFKTTASHTPSTDAAATARGASHTAIGATRGVRATSKAASANKTSPTAVATSIGEVGVHTATVGNAVTADACITFYQATPAVAGDTTRAAVAAGRPPDDGGATRDTIGGPGTRNTTAISGQTSAIDATNALTGDASGDAGGGRLGTRTEPRAAANATKDSVVDTRGERAAPRGSLERLLRVLRGLGSPNGPPR